MWQSVPRKKQCGKTNPKTWSNNCKQFRLFQVKLLAYNQEAKMFITNRTTNCSNSKLLVHLN
uniref:Uncharacterized protein n=1 Tax=Arundo donax TaxID=35708 RepID=A0A0A9EKS6_ARUDO